MTSCQPQGRALFLIPFVILLAGSCKTRTLDNQSQQRALHVLDKNRIFTITWDLTKGAFLVYDCAQPRSAMCPEPSYELDAKSFAKVRADFQEALIDSRIKGAQIARFKDSVAMTRTDLEATIEQLTTDISSMRGPFTRFRPQAKAAIKDLEQKASDNQDILREAQNFEIFVDAVLGALTTRLMNGRQVYTITARPDNNTPEISSSREQALRGKLFSIPDDGSEALKPEFAADRFAGFEEIAEAFFRDVLELALLEPARKRAYENLRRQAIEQGQVLVRYVTTCFAHGSTFFKASFAKESFLFARRLPPDLSAIVRGSYEKAQDAKVDREACFEHEKKLQREITSGNLADRVRAELSTQFSNDFRERASHQSDVTIFVKPESKPEYCLAIDDMKLARDLELQPCPSNPPG